MKTKTKANKVPFVKLTPAQKRVAIAKDALSQIAKGKYWPQTGIYIQWNGENLNQATLTERKRPTCTVCQLGAALCSAIRLGNHLDFDPISTYVITSKLKKWFSPTQMILMEAAFERTDSPASYNHGATQVSQKQRDAARKFGCNFGFSVDRQRAIFRNIVRNKGTFKP